MDRAENETKRDCTTCANMNCSTLEYPCKDCIKHECDNPANVRYTKWTPLPKARKERPAFTTREDILREAKRCVCGERENTYGGPENNFQTIANLWNDYIYAVGEHPLTAKDVAAMMALLKIARIATGKPKKDNWVDLAGYAACGGEIDEEDGDHE